MPKEHVRLSLVLNVMLRRSDGTLVAQRYKNYPVCAKSPISHCDGGAGEDLAPELRIDVSSKDWWSILSG